MNLSFTVKDEDLEGLRNWVRSNRVPLYIIQVFYDQAYVLSFETLEYLISLGPSDKRRVTPEVDRLTRRRPT